jgi:hypothetical protein
LKKLIVLVALLMTSVLCSATPLKIVFNSFQTGGWQVGYPYMATVNAVPGIAVMCDDWEHGGGPGQTWQANFTDLASGNLSLLRFNQLPNAPTLYKEAGWLLLQTRVTPSANFMDINYAVWHTFDSTAPLPGNSATWLNSAQQEALAGFPGVDFSKVGIFTPLNQYGDWQGHLDPGAPQELLTLVASVPEPTSLVLLVGGLAGLVARKKFF